jgi:sugar phosphate permease
MLFASTVINYIDRQTLSALSPFLKEDYHWSNADYAKIVIAFRIAYAIGQTVLGRWLDRGGTRAGLTRTVLCYSLVSIATWAVRPQLYQSMAVRPVAWFFAVVMVGGGWALWTGLARLRARPGETRAFVGSCAVIVGLLGAAAAGVFPEFLHSTLSPEYSLTAYGGAASGRGLAVALVWWPVAAGLAAVYFVTVSRQFAGKVGSGI